MNLRIGGRCQLWDKELEVKEMEEQLKELVGLLRQSELRRKEVEKELKLREQAIAIALANSASVRVAPIPWKFFLFNLLILILTLLTGLQQGNSLEHFADEVNGPVSPIPVPAHQQMKYTAGIANGSLKDSVAFMNQTRKVISRFVNY